MCTTLGIGAASISVGIQNSYLKNQNNKLNNENKELSNINGSLNDENKELSNNNNQSNQQIEDLNNSLNDLQDIVDQYGQTLSIVLFEVNGENYDTEVVQRGGEVELPDLADTETTYFLGWKINGKGEIYRGTYTATQPTKFVAVIANKAVVNFVVNGEISSTEYHKHGVNITLPDIENTTTQYYNGWKVNGEGDSLKGVYNITQDVNLTLDMANKAVVNFIMDGVITETQYVIHGESVVLPTKPDTESKYFNGWKIEGTGESYKGNYQVNQDVNFVVDMVNDPVVKFVVNGNVEQVVSVKHGETITLPTKDDTTTQYFNGWKIEGEGGSYLGSYTVTKDVNFVLDMINHPVVTYSVNNKVVERLYVKHGDIITLPTRLDSETQYYKGWKVNGVGASYNDTYKVTRDVNFVLDMVNKAVVSYQVDGKITGSEYVKHGETITLPTKPNTETEFYNGWKVDGVGDSFKKYTVTSDVVLVLDMTTDNAWVATNDVPVSIFKGIFVWNCGNDTYYSNGSDQYVLDKKTNVWQPKTWNGKTNIDGRYVWTDGENYFYSKSNYQYLLNGDTWSKVTWNGLNIDGQYVWTDGTKYYYSNGTTHYEFNKSTRTWATKTWDGLTSFYGEDVWTDGKNIYCSQTVSSPSPTERTTSHYVLSISSSYWAPMTWTGETNFDGNDVWTDGINYYASNYQYRAQLVLEPSSHTWSVITWNGDLKQPTANYIWSDGVYFYYSCVESSNPYLANGQCVLSGTTWIDVTWTGIGGLFSYPYYSMGNCIWTDGVDTYCSLGNYGVQLVMNKKTNTWETMYWKGYTDIMGDYVWTDGENYFYSKGTLQYVLDVSMHAWFPMKWNGLTIFSGYNIWTDGTNIYYSYGSSQYSLNRVTKTWSAMTWNGLTNFDGNGVWTDGKNYFYSSSTKHYVLDTTTYTWIEKTWNGETNFYGRYVWTDGTNIYYSQYETIPNSPSIQKQYVLDVASNTWSTMEWNGFEYINAEYIYVYNGKIYCTNISWNHTYVLNTSANA